MTFVLLGELFVCLGRMLLKLKPASASQVIGALYKCLLYNRLLGRSQFPLFVFVNF